VAVSFGEILVVGGVDLLQVVLEPIAGGGGEHGRPVFAAFGVVNGEMSEVEIDVLDSEAEALEDAKAGAVEEEDYKLGGALELGDDRSGLFAAEDGRQALGLSGADEVIDPGYFLSEDFSIEEEQGGEGLALGGGCDMLFDCEVGEEAVDLFGTHIARMFHVVESKEAPDPGEVSLFGADGIVTSPDR
jgi:hypothetical protein